MRLSLQARYAICGMFDLAYHADGGWVQVRVIGERQRIPARYLEQIFQRLRRARLVRGKRGPGGGYALARPAGEISLRAIVEAVEGSIGRELQAGPPGPAPQGPHFLWEPLGAALEQALEGFDLGGLCRRAAAEAVRRADAETRMWHI